MATAERRVTAGDEMLERVAQLEPVIRGGADQAEELRRLPDEVAEALVEAGFCRLFRPRVWGGLELDPVSAFRVIEELSRIDSAAGWNVTQANAMEPMAAWLSQEAGAAIFGSPDTVLAGSFFAPRRAIPTEGGYRLSGRCAFNSNCHAATWICALANVYEDGSGGPTVGEDGHPVTLLTFFPRGEAEIVDNWDTLGMRGTGSHDIVVDDLFVPSEHAIVFGPLEEPNPAHGGPLHRLTIWHSIGCDAVPALGIAQAAIDDFLRLLENRTSSHGGTPPKERSIVQLRLGRAIATLEGARAYFYGVFRDAWDTALAGRRLDMDAKIRIQAACSSVPIAAAEAVDLVHSLLGTSGIRHENPFARHFRDIHTLTQHAYVSEARFTAVGQVALGLEPDWGFLHF
ncbi:MAG: acyl-CoA dehydrogenase family protein [Gemmatimonadota bacterium]